MTSEGDSDAPGGGISTADAVRQLLALAPGLEEEFRVYLSEWIRDAPSGDLSGPGIYNVWGDLVAPRFARPAFDKGATGDLIRLFALVEDFLADGDQAVRTFVRVDVCDEYVYRPAWRALAEPLMGTETRRLSNDMAQDDQPGS